MGFPLAENPSSPPSPPLHKKSGCPYGGRERPSPREGKGPPFCGVFLRGRTMALLFPSSFRAKWKRRFLFSLPKDQPIPPVKIGFFYYPLWDTGGPSFFPPSVMTILFTIPPFPRGGSSSSDICGKKNQSTYLFPLSPEMEKKPFFSPSDAVKEGACRKIRKLFSGELVNPPLFS